MIRYIRTLSSTKVREKKSRIQAGQERDIDWLVGVQALLPQKSGIRNIVFLRMTGSVETVMVTLYMPFGKPLPIQLNIVLMAVLVLRLVKQNIKMSL